MERSESRGEASPRAPELAGEIFDITAFFADLHYLSGRNLTQLEFIRDTLRALLEYTRGSLAFLRLQESGLERLYWLERGSALLGTERLEGNRDHWTGDGPSSAVLDRVSRWPGRLKIPLKGVAMWGSLELFSRPDERMVTLESAGLQELGERLELAFSHQRAQWALRERVKELTCLYEIAKVASRAGASFEELLQEVVNLLPPAWQYPEITVARLCLDEKFYTSMEFRWPAQKQSADILIQGERRGFVEVGYLEERPDIDEGPFLQEERSLITEIARQVALLVGRRQVELERLRLEEQLRHADRLATIGLLAAGVAHEINEPLGGILGFAQLAQKHPNLPRQVDQDLDKIVRASLHAREVVRKLLLFARQMPPRKARVSLNRLVEEGLFLLESRSTKERIVIEKELQEGLPELVADPSQLHQVLVNLAVNAIQAMPAGGTLTIRTRSEPDMVILEVQDTGVGMSEELVKQIYMPFFTTKDVGQGTGLGLPVVHGIVTAHGGELRLETTLGVGSRFEIRLPLNPV